MTERNRGVSAEDDPDRPKDVNEAMRTSDGAVRQLEKAAIIASTADQRLPEVREISDEGPGEVIPLGKDPGGAPEDAVADAAEADPER